MSKETFSTLSTHRVFYNTLSSRGVIDVIHRRKFCLPRETINRWFFNSSIGVFSLSFNSNFLLSELIKSSKLRRLSILLDLIRNRNERKKISMPRNICEFSRFDCVLEFIEVILIEKLSNDLIHDDD